MYFCLFMSLSFWSLLSHAEQIIEDTENNITYYVFGEDTEWQLQGAENGAGNSSWMSASKSGSIKNYKHIYHYLLNIDQNRLILRLSMQDEDEDEHKYDLEPDNLVVKDVTMDGKRISLFQWCLDNQQPASDVLNHSAQVKDAACTNSKDIGEFVMRLDSKTKRAFIKAKNIEISFLVEDEKINLVYSMKGFSKVMYQVDSDLMPRSKIKKIVKIDNKKSIKNNLHLAQVSANKAIKNSNRICYVRPALDYKMVIKAIPYPCDDKVKQATAQGFISAQIQYEKQKIKDALATAKLKKDIQKTNREKMLALKRKRAQKIKKINGVKVAFGNEINESASSKKRDWDINQSVMWISRCKKRWDKGFSPCFCKKYIKQAPVGVQDTCDD